jgi:hypothetical protein
MRRREFIAGLAAAALPLAAGAQQVPLPAIGYLSGGTETSDRNYIAAFRRGLPPRRCRPVASCLGRLVAIRKAPPSGLEAA